MTKWIREFDIADELILRPDSDTGNFKAYLKRNKSDILLADYGLGTNQLLPIIFGLATHKQLHGIRDNKFAQRTVVIEEPEANLHPAMQSKLADMFVDANKKFNVQIIAETHSEYLIRKLQYLVAKQNITPEEIKIYYFNHPRHLDPQEKQIKAIEIFPDGSLSDDFGPGFFDEAINLKLDLLKLKNSQKN
jgi:predicted ATPase